MNVGLLFVAASIYQMTRGALVLFVGTFSVLFLKRKLYLYHWLSLVVVVLGVGLVGLAGAISSGDKNPHRGIDEKLDLAGAAMLMAKEVAAQATDQAVLRTILGVFLIAFAQIFTATQFVLEEFILEKYALQPLKVVAWEGTFGLVVTLLAQLILYLTVGTTRSGKYGYFDAEEGYREVFTNRTIATTSLLIMVSIGGFNFFGLSVTRSISATSRSIIGMILSSITSIRTNCRPRYVPNFVHLDCFTRTGMGNVQVASGCGLCLVGIRDFYFQRSSTATNQGIDPKKEGGTGSSFKWVTTRGARRTIWGTLICGQE